MLWLHELELEKIYWSVSSSTGPTGSQISQGKFSLWMRPYCPSDKPSQWNWTQCLFPVIAHTYFGPEETTL